MARISPVCGSMATMAPILPSSTFSAAIFASEEGVVGLLDAGPADDVAGGVEGVAGVVEHLFGDFADVADEVSGEAVAWVEATLLVEGFEFGELVAVGGDA